MRILFLTDNFPPETNAPATRTYDHAVRWVRAGHDVTVVTCAPNFPEGRVYPGYRNAWHQAAMVEGIRVVRVKTYLSANEGVFLRTLDFVSFVPGAVAAALLEPTPDVILGTSPQFFTGVATWLVARLRRRPYILEVRDLWPESIAAVGAIPAGLTLRALARIEGRLYRDAAAIVTATPGLEQTLARRGVSPDKLTTVLNGIDTDVIQPLVRDAELARELRLTDKFVVGYIGTVGLAHALGTALVAAERLASSCDVAFLIVGSGAARTQLVRDVETRRLANVVMLPRQPRAMISRLLALCDACLVSLKDVPLFGDAIPSKLFEAMATGKPVILAVPEGDASELVRSEGIGITVPPENPEALVAAIQRLKDDAPLCRDMGARGERLSRRYTRDSGAAAFLPLMQRVVGTL